MILRSRKIRCCPCARSINCARLFSRTPRGWSGVDHSCCNSGCQTCVGSACSGPAIPGGQVGSVNGDVVIQNDSDLKTLKNVTEIIGDLTINSTALSTLSGLENLKHVSGNAEHRQQRLAHQPARPRGADRRRRQRQHSIQRRSDQPGRARTTWRPSAAISSSTATAR